MTAVAVMVAVVIAGCTAGARPSGEASSSRPRSGDREAAAPSPAGRAPRVEPRWTPVDMPPEALLSEARATFGGGVLAGSDRLPHMVAGTIAEPGRPDHVRIWTSGDTRRWNTTDVEVHDGAAAAVNGSATDGRSTAVLGNTWSVDHGPRPFVLRSADRTAWEEVTLPRQGAAPFQPQRVFFDGDGALVLLGLDGSGLPVAVRVDEGGRTVALPAPEDGLSFTAFADVAVDGDDVLVIGYLNAPGEFRHPVAYHSADGGATWTQHTGPTGDTAQVNGVVRAGDRWVATGWRWRDRFKAPAAWSSADGRGWRVEDVPGIGELTDREWGEIADGELGAPSVRGRQVVTVFRDQRDFNSAVVQRDPSGRWSVHGRSNDWIAAAADAAVARLEDGSALMARWVRNSGIVGVVSPAGRWRTVIDTIGPNDPGLRWRQVTFDGRTPVLFGRTSRIKVDMRDGRWTRWEDRPTLRRFAFTGDDAVAAAPWDPEASGNLHNIAVATDDDGATVVLGEQPTDSWDEPNLPDRSDAAGWFRASPDDRWTRAEGMRGAHAETVHDGLWLGDRWIAVGWEDRLPAGADHYSATTAVWTSSDGVRWRRERGEFRVSDGVDSLGTTACALPDGAGALVFGDAITVRTRRRVPTVWRRAGDRWRRLDAAALGDGAGWAASCALHGDTALLHGSLGGRDTLWHTTDGATFEATALPEASDRITGPLRAFAGGFAAGGTRGQGAVVWLSRDGREWTAHPVPSNRLLLTATVLEWNGRLIVAGSSTGDPEVWILENPDELLAGPGAAS